MSDAHAHASQATVLRLLFNIAVVQNLVIYLAVICGCLWALCLLTLVPSKRTRRARTKLAPTVVHTVPKPSVVASPARTNYAFGGYRPLGNLNVRPPLFVRGNTTISSVQPPDR